MFKRFLTSCFLFSICSVHSFSQELNATVKVLTVQLPPSVNRTTFTSLEKALTDFLNQQKWTNERFQTAEKIRCSFLLNLTSVSDDNTIKGNLVVQAARPIYNADYSSPLINYQDDDVAFSYVQAQPLLFSINRVAGNNPLQANLTAIFAYYVNIILGLEFDSFSLNGGLSYFQNAQTIVASAPRDANISGWVNQDGLKNRYWLSQNLNYQRLDQIHNCFYEYYRKGLDQMSEHPEAGRKAVLATLKKLQSINAQNPNSMIMQQFFQGKSSELIGIFKKAIPSDRSEAKDILSQIDAANVAKYISELK